MGLIQLYTWMIWIAHSMTGDLSSFGSSDLSHIRCHIGASSLLSFTFGASPRCHFRLGHPPLSFTFGASPRCHLCLGHPPAVIYVWGIPPLSFTFGAFPHCHFRLGHPPTVIFVWGIPHCHFRLGHPPTVILFRAFPCF